MQLIVVAGFLTALAMSVLLFDGVGEAKLFSRSTQQDPKLLLKAAEKDSGTSLRDEIMREFSSKMEQLQASLAGGLKRQANVFDSVGRDLKQDLARTKAAIEQLRKDVQQVSGDTTATTVRKIETVTAPNLQRKIVTEMDSKLEDLKRSLTSSLDSKITSMKDAIVTEVRQDRPRAEAAIKALRKDVRRASSNTTANIAQAMSSFTAEMKRLNARANASSCAERRTSTRIVEYRKSPDNNITMPVSKVLRCPEEAVTVCGSNVVLSKDQPRATLTSRGYPRPYGPLTRCVWNVTALPDRPSGSHSGRRLLITVEEMDIEGPSPCCQHDSLTIAGAATRCGRLSDQSWLTRGGSASVVFVSDANVQRRGFKLSVMLASARTEMKAVEVQVMPPDKNGLVEWTLVPLGGGEVIWGAILSKARRRLFSRIDATALAMQFGVRYIRAGIARRALMSSNVTGWDTKYRDEDDGVTVSSESRTYETMHFLLSNSAVRPCLGHLPVVEVRRPARVMEMSAGRLAETTAASLLDPTALALVLGIEVVDGRRQAVAQKFIRMATGGYCDASSGEWVLKREAAVKSVRVPSQQQHWRYIYVVIRDGDELPRFGIPSDKRVAVYSRHGVDITVTGRRLRRTGGRPDLPGGTWTQLNIVGELHERLTAAMRQ